MICYTVSKYDNNVAAHNEWTDYSDIGKVFDGKKLTINEYLSVEQRYIDFVFDIMNLSEVSALSLNELEAYENIKWCENQIINALEVPEVMRDVLRNRCWCKLKGENFCLCFGFDFYLHVKTNVDYDSLIHMCDRYGLFIKEKVNGK